MPRRVPRKPRPKKINVPKGYDSAWEFDMHQTILKDWKHHWDVIKYVVKHPARPIKTALITKNRIVILITYLYYVNRM